MHKLVLSVLALIAAIGAAPALAQTTYYAGETTSFTQTIPVTATVGGRCQFATGGAPNGSYTIPGSIDTDGWNRDFGFSIECNTASRVAVVSTNGGLKTGATVNSSGYTGLAPYNVQLTLVGNLGPTISPICSAASLEASAGSGCAYRGPASTLNGQLLAGPSQGQNGSKITVSAPAYATTAAGATTALVSGSDYTDTLTITIASAI